jgi:single-strand DNA-binding protein
LNLELGELEIFITPKAIFMRGVNKVVLVGNVGRNPDVQYIEGDIPMAKFPLATTETRRDSQGQLISETEWHTIVLWRGLADLAAKYLHKGSLVYVEGRLRTRKWEDKEKGWRSQTEILADNIIMLDKRKDGNAGNSNGTVSEVKKNDSEGLSFDLEADDSISDTLPF